MENEVLKKENHFDYLDKAIPFISDCHLDIGCGDGSITKYLSGEKPTSKIVGFDIDEDKIKSAQNKTGPIYTNLSFISDLNDEIFKSGSAFRSFHEIGSDIFNLAANHLETGSMFVIIDYDLIKETENGQQTKNMNDIFYSLSEFQNIFNSEQELKEVKEIGWQNAYFSHTEYNRHTCQKMGEESNFFETLECKKINKKLFIWVGRKK